MIGQGRPLVLCLISTVGLLGGSALGLFGGSTLPAAAAEVPTPLRPQLEDAQLRDVHFIDRAHGVAVGDRGVIWMTRDGGRRWHLRSSGTTARLESVRFTDAENGWACGGSAHPYTHTTSGVLLRTRDGGRTWGMHGRQTLPALKRVAFFNAAQGYFVGDSSAIFPAGIAFTDDGGRSWRPVTAHGRSNWLAGDFVDPHNGATAGRDGKLTAVRQRQIVGPKGQIGPSGNLVNLKLTKTGRGWCVGDGGLILMTNDHGHSWQTPEGGLPSDVADSFDWRAIALRGEKCWIAGTPGSRIARTSDGGRTWRSFPTGQSLPLYALDFVDDRHGWAVGALGLILTTRDGGVTWQKQHAGGRRCAVLAVHGTAQSIPLELIALLAGNDGYRTAVTVLCQPQASAVSKSNHDLPRRTHQAVSALGGVGAETAWRFPLRQPNLDLRAERLVEDWQQVEDAFAEHWGRSRVSAIERLEKYVVRQVRMWRPEVVVTDHASPSGEDPLAHLVNQIVIRAVAGAADPSSYPNLGGLDTWEVKKVVAHLPATGAAPIDLSTAQFAPRLGQSLADAATVPRGLINDRFVPSRPSLRFRVDVDRIAQGLGKRDVLSGIHLQPGGDARRELYDSHDPSTIDHLRRAAQKNRLLRAMIDRSMTTQAPTGHLVAQLGDLTEGLDPASAGGVLFELAQHYHRAGQWEAAAETFSAQIDRYADHPLSEAALVWLIQYWSSAEVAANIQAQLPENFRQAAAVAARGRVPGRRPPTPVLPGHDRPAATEYAEDRPATNQTLAHRGGRASRLAKLVQRFYPALYGEPTIGFPIITVNRRSGAAAPSRGVSPIGGDEDAWQACIDAERWLERPSGEAPKPVWICSQAQTKPRLDGKLDDEVWQRATKMPLKGRGGGESDWPAEAMLAYDAEFLYLAVRCRNVPDVQYTKSDAKRSRDADLSRHDRVELLIDLDRDYATWYRLAVNYQGSTHDSCWESAASWNPTWYVAAGEESQAWVIEAAVPLVELTSEPITQDTAWAIGVQRTVPGADFQSWTTPAAPRPRAEGFGLLRFE